MKGLIILGSSRSDGETATVAEIVSQKTGFEVVDLLKLEINRFDYENSFSNDDFIGTVKKMTEADTVVLASPVYWYSMSGVMKDFIDRFTDLLRFEKDMGRSLRGKRMALLSSSSGQEFPDYFVQPFADTAAYLGMKFLGHLHSWEENGVNAVPETELDQFSQKLL